MQRSWAHAQVRRAYPEFVSELDMLTPEDVVWEPYSPEAVGYPCTSRPVFALLRECEPVAY